MCTLNQPGPHLPPAVKSWSHRKREMTCTIPLSSAASPLQALSSLHFWLLQRETVINTWGFRTTLLLQAALCPPPPNHLLSPDPKYGFPGGSVIKNLSTNAGDAASVLDWEDPLGWLVVHGRKVWKERVNTRHRCHRHIFHCCCVCPDADHHSRQRLLYQEEVSERAKFKDSQHYYGKCKLTLIFGYSKPTDGII